MKYVVIHWNSVTKVVVVVVDVTSIRTQIVTWKFSLFHDENLQTALPQPANRLIYAGRKNQIRYDTLKVQKKKTAVKPPIYVCSKNV